MPGLRSLLPGRSSKAHGCLALGNAARDLDSRGDLLRQRDLLRIHMRRSVDFAGSGLRQFGLPKDMPRRTRHCKAAILDAYSRLVAVLPSSGFGADFPLNGADELVSDSLRPRPYDTLDTHANADAEPAAPKPFSPLVYNEADWPPEESPGMPRREPPREADRMRVAVVGVGHWHAQQMYIPALKGLGVDIVAISDPDADALDRTEVDCARYLDRRELLVEARPDFVFAHAPHCDMTLAAADLVAACVPFAMEKPMGVDWRALAEVAEEAAKQDLFVASALVTRYLALVEKLAELRDAGELGKPVHYYSRLFAGTPHRYREWNVGWMLEPEKAGAGPLFNFGPHVIDIYLYLTGDSIDSVSAVTTHGLYSEAIEDLTSVTFRGASGAIGVVEISYTHPDAYERYFSLTTDALHVGGDIEGDTIHLRGGDPIDVEPNAAALDTYAVYTEDTLRRFAAGEPPVASIHDMVPVLRVMNAAQRSIEAGRAINVADVT